MQSQHGDVRVPVADLQFDSRKVTTGSCFVATRGTITDGHLYINKAIEKGAKSVVCEELPADLIDNITYIVVENSSEALGQMVANFYDHPSQKLKLVGVTGTNGKSTTVTLLYDLFTELGYKVGLLSTIENKIGRKIVDATHTTPDAVTINLLIQEMVDAGCDYVFMEVSSHAIHQKRIAGLAFTGGVFTNITHDHLDYHNTFKEYIYAKKEFFDNLPKTAFALTNTDDKRGMVMLQNTKAKKQTYSIRSMADFKAKILDNSLTGLHLEMDGEEFFGRLIGIFNAYNLLAVFATAMLLKQDKSEVLVALSVLKAAEGRFDYIQNQTTKIIGIVDYAHTPDALEKVLMTIHKLHEGNGQIITVVGCGGDRDRGKRPKMAKVACDYSDQIILTSDNPRSEDPDVIIEEMEVGIPPYNIRNVLSITNRKQAIKTACTIAKSGDIILIAGKGHEKYQEIKGERKHFDDKEELRDGLGLTVHGSR
ncbi:MAG: UDP-N-acetylmuramoyl-L-alanyl-D-glutamate--2,6-diaminopimelate ligase [Paraglaciecola sp.]|jgi:UDP-N-acetylmuramoyl-L-alanyl-D-glutamate--2,6-diaminopimelate ligase